MSKKYIAAAAIIILVIAGAWYLTRPPKIQEVTNPTQTEEENKQFEKNTVYHTNDGFAPNPLNIKVGETVLFRNDGSRPTWIASAMHPTHTVYPTTGGCIGSTFDSCVGIEPGKSWSFKFDFVGSWKYHDHLNPTSFGTIIVE